MPVETWRAQGWEYTVCVWQDWGRHGSWRVVKTFLSKTLAEQYAEALRLGEEPRDRREVGLADTA